MHFQGADVDAPVKNPSIAALIGRRRRGEVWVARVNGWAAREGRMGEGRAAVVLERAKHRAGIDLIARYSQETASIIAAQIVAQ